jgi:DNA-directed RNA polymerase specialized sigma24 family protein
MLYSFDFHATEINVPQLPTDPALRKDAYPDTDEQLMERIKRGDEAALGILLYRHLDACRSLARRMVPDEAQSEALVHEVFAEVSREAVRYSPMAGSVLGWVLTLVRRRSIAKLRTPSPEPMPLQWKQRTVPAVMETGKIAA